MIQFTILPGKCAAQSEESEEVGTVFPAALDNLSPVGGRTEWGLPNSLHWLTQVSLVRDENPIPYHYNGDSSQTLTLKKV